ncbi:MAG: hypothetical protein JWN84_1685 [Nocardioides sp.]|nr:hypothetical protein [Nocardioides sp.]
MVKRRRVDLFRPFYKTVRRMTSAGSPSDALEAVTEGVVESVGFAVAAVSWLTSDGRFEVVSVAGSDNARAALLGTSVSMAEMERELEASELWGSLLFLPARKLDSIAPGWVPDASAIALDGDWHPEDTLRCPLRSADGELTGLLAVDLPRDGRRPGPDQRELLEMYADLAGLALASARRTARLKDRVRLAEAVKATLRAAQVANVPVDREDGDHAGSTLLRSLLDGTIGPAGRALQSEATWLRVFESADNPHMIVHTGLQHGGPPPGDLGASLTALARAAWADEGVVLSSADADRWVSTSPPTTAAEEQVPVAGSKAGWIMGRRSQEVPTDVRSPEAAAYVHASGLDQLLLSPLGVGSECVGYLIVGRTAGAWLPEEVDAATQIGRHLGQAVMGLRLAEREQVLVERLQSLDRYKNSLISTVSHELRTPLTSVTGYLELLEEAVPEVMTAGPFVPVIRRNVDRMLALTDELLQLERLGRDAGQQPAAEVVDLRLLVQEAVTQFRAMADEQEVRLEATLVAGPVHLHGNRHDLDTIVTNLLSNAVKYTPAGGVITVVLERTDRFVRLAVADTGIGISEADQEELFTEFFRSTNAEALALPGTGLGLSIVRRIAQRHGGSIRLVSTPGEGSTFTVRLPLTHLPAVPQA